MEWPEYEKKIKEFGYNRSAVSSIKQAYDFAKKAHISEKRFSGEPYFIHPVQTSLSIAKLKLDPETVSAALLHDVVENQNVKIEEIKKLFGEEVAFLVDGVTKVDKIKYKGIERTIESLRKMFLALAEDIRVVLIKLMDRLHNMQTLQFVRAEKQKRIALETLELYAPLADRLGMWEIKAELEDLAFPFVYPEEFEWLKIQVQEKREAGKKYIETLNPIVERELLRDGVKPLKIQYRIKNLFSIWQKVVKNEMDISRVRDIVAMRITVRSLEDCYQTLGVIHKLWKPVPGKIKDYIALPKPNGYQSLHTSVFGPEKKIVEFQIRTVEMDEEAKYGIAAHWVYKSNKQNPEKLKKTGEDKLRWVRQLQEWHKESEGSSTEALNALKIDFFRDRIFAFTPKGDVIDLPEGATPIDFAYNIHSEIGDKMFGAKVNGKMVQFSHQLKSGDTVEILTQKNKKPTSDWLDYAHTSMARNRIRAAVRKVGPGTAGNKKGREVLEAVVTVKDRVGVLRDVSAVFSDMGINIAGTKSGPLSREHHRLVVNFFPKKGLPNSKILTGIKKISGVESVSIKQVT
ncbi:bifunctional (p)ppGpp synthetase/guanosine-3',5'-bis(diphosphate) 3'-pyrophosphohydrolase [Candidatus Giovannonibacteria bacterium]|nr:bifunctional (p)ppGpp synthetase/guanosine-3',5'-bis(diphosphate) 3'-pyrophosphohydrolase [Candidatus Giovannonibacteria bacterium]